MQHQVTQEDTQNSNSLPNAGQFAGMQTGNLETAALRLEPAPELFAATEISREDSAEDTVEKPGASTASASEITQQTHLIKRLRRKLAGRSFLPMQDAYWETPGPLSTYQFDATLNALRNPALNAWRERMLCAWLLGHAPLTRAQQHKAARELGKVAQNRHATLHEQFRAQLQTTVLRTLPLAGISSLWITFNIIAPTAPHHSPLDLSIFVSLAASLFIILAILLFPGVFVLTALFNMDRTNRVRSAAILALARMRVAASVGALARATLAMSPGIRNVAEESLRQCLPQLTPEHYGQLDTDTIPALCRLLDVKKERLFANHTHTEQLVIDVLEALGKIGDGSAVRHVESIAEDGWTENVRNAAREVLPILLQRQQQENNPRLLLRGSSAPPTAAEQLLRSSLSSPSNPPDASQQLLRSANEP